MSNNIYLRALELEDYKVSIRWRQDDEIWDLLGGPKYFVSESYEKKWVENAINSSTDIRLAICVKETDKYIGNVYITNIDTINRTCCSHIFIGDKSCWGKGFATQALLLVLSYIFRERNMNRVEAKVLEHNTASLKLHQKCGYKIEGLLRNSVFKNGFYRNQYILAILSSEFTF